MLCRVLTGTASCVSVISPSARATAVRTREANVGANLWLSIAEDGDALVGAGCMKKFRAELAARRSAHDVAYRGR
jgi:hypothetical protein